MVTRFTDDLFTSTEGSDFIVRKWRPPALQLVFIFASAIVIIHLSALIMNDLGNRWFFFLILLAIIGSLGAYTVFYAARIRDLLLATEFQNTMLASAVQLGTKFCLITKRDGTIVYIDPGFQQAFPHFMRSGSHSIDGLLRSAGIESLVLEQVHDILFKNQNDRLLLDFKNSDRSSERVMVTIEVLQRPRGYFLFRGRDFVENRAAGSFISDSSAHSLQAHALDALEQGAAISNSAGRIIYANPALEDRLGYDPGELSASGKHLQQLFQHYLDVSANPTQQLDYRGKAILQHKSGAMQPFVVRQEAVHENGQFIGVVAIAEPFDRPHNTLSQEKIQEAALHLSQFIALSPLAIARLASDGTVLECNQSLRELVTFRLPEAGWPFLDVVKPEDRADVTSFITKIAAGQPIEKKFLEIELSTEETITASLYLNRIDSGSGMEIIAQLIDTREQKNLEQRFAHSQKMQAVGQLAGGVAHDFNNLLTAMIGFCDLLLMRHPAGDQSFADIMQVKQNANRAANLVRQLLAFSRRQTLQPKMLDITDVLAELSNLIRRLIGENIELKVIHGRDLGMVKADQGQLEQVFINLAVNARDAMQNGGRLTIQTSHVTISDANPIDPALIPPVEDEAIVSGDYVLVEIIDTGTGIPQDLLQKIFEPFFSTKEVGSGTGLGLATVYGIIKQTGGYVYVLSEEGKGTNFSLFLKRYQATEAKPVVENEAPDRTALDDLTGKGTILLVEDETPVRAFAARALRNKGYTVLEADCGEMAIEVMDKQGNEVDVIITDVIMPGINGPTMIETVAPRFPRVKVVFISGYAEDVFVKSYGSEREFHFLPKPFTLKQLASKVKEVMAL